MDFFKRRKARKELDALASTARSLRNMRCDILGEADLKELDAAIDEARSARGAALDAMESAAKRLDSIIGSLGWRRNPLLENFEVLAVAIAVAMAFRCYFFQPFKIPTGSMQPTLYGISSVDCDAGFWDRAPFMYAAWLVTGSTYREIVAERTGNVVLLMNDNSKPGYAALSVAGKVGYVPSDVLRDLRDLSRLHLRAIPPGGETFARGYGPILGTVRAGDKVWSGRVVSGDHVFVNRLTWNFRRPRRGDVMVFSTKGIKGLPQGTHYIKRMTGLPGETISIDPPRLMVDGVEAAGPETIARICRREHYAPWAPDYIYAGYQPIGDQMADTDRALRTRDSKFKLAAGEYFAMGDNTVNSRDSRYWGAVPRSNLLGPGCMVYWPFTSPRFGLIK